MLGLIFTGGEGPAPEVIKRVIDNEINGARIQDALIIAADSGLNAAENARLRPDWIIGDMDSLDDSRKLDSYPKESVIRHKHDKDFTDTELAFLLAREKGCAEIWIIGGGGGRIDHLFGIKSMFERDDFPARWITSVDDIFCVDAGSGEQGLKNSFIFSAKKNASIAVFPLGEGPWEAKSAGLKWRLDSVKWSRGFFGLSNVAVDGNFSITALKGRFMAITPL
ncbi:MAG: thiamine diphosphokinase [Treponema sp.]|nr:thiamine diphosphokinase [Treponema sp.]